ncbi:MAG: aldehyde ferredoxin oxidoreductase family protein [Bacillota bacterium]
MTLHGYAGRYLRVDLTTGHIKTVELDPVLARTYLGGNGFGTRLLWDEVGPEVDPLSPGNLLVLATGPLSGTTWPGSGRLEVIAKSPLSGAYGDSNSGGFFGPELKYAGFDMVVFQGRSPRPVYLYIEDGHAELRDASTLWGKGTYETEALIRQELGDPDIKTCTIGPAGENLVRFACINVSYMRSAGRAGMGAVMGSKLLKAVAVRGFGGVTLADPGRFWELTMAAHQRIRQNFLYPMVRQYGSAGLTALVNMTGRFPTKNFQLGAFDEHPKIGGEALEKYVVKHLACFACPVACDKAVRLDEGEFRGTLTSSLEYEAVGSLGGGIGNSHLESIVRGNRLCDDLGMDIISAGRTISFLMELGQRGIIPPDFADGLDLSWGNYHTMLALLEKTALRQGVGNLLAEGVRRMALEIGPESEPYAMHVKGQEIACQDGRGQQSMGLAHVTSTRGADHLKAYPTIDETGFPSPAVARYGEQYMPELIDPHAVRHKPMIVKDGEDFSAVVDASGHCKIGGTFVIAEIDWEDEAGALQAATGWNITADELKAAGERIYNLQRCYNVLHGLGRAQDTLPRRMLTEPNPSGTGRGRVVELETMLDEYYVLRGWDLKTGVPTRARLLQLGLEDAAERLKL